LKSRLSDVKKGKIRKWNRFNLFRMMSAKRPGALALVLFGALLGVPLIFSNTDTTADVDLHVQLPDGYNNIGQFTAVATDTLTHRQYQPIML